MKFFALLSSKNTYVEPNMIIIQVNATTNKRAKESPIDETIINNNGTGNKTTQ